MIETKHLTIVEFDSWVETADENFGYELHDGIVCTVQGCSWVRFRFARTQTGRHRSSRRVGNLRAATAPPSNYVTLPTLVVEVISPASA